MKEHLFALVVHDCPEPFESLKRTLRELSVEAFSIETCREAENLIGQCRPHLIFTQGGLQDGSWLRVLNLAEASDPSPKVIVVGAFPDTRLYLSVMEKGAFDFVAPPFEPLPLGFVVRTAELDVRRRDALARAAVA